ncbi:hypothetical protein H6G89_15010 [Oscillatoria sp. FACHB-1407]|uniref:hypothetical protein n=1 Tax=Oscillatoria sp. FACHB-1407 TaxID=2692847 RepID=UPI0016831D3E|nr:hypothetical protein [Oscillatoria sp. FACHB-1407]MBD2462355.1 hypothetical protein [Oscillatoria sp. FACHB-1407]
MKHRPNRSHKLSNDPIERQQTSSKCSEKALFAAPTGLLALLCQAYYGVVLLYKLSEAALPKSHLLPTNFQPNHPKITSPEAVQTAGAAIGANAAVTRHVVQETKATSAV